MNVYNCSSYQEFLDKSLATSGVTRGLRSKLAKQLNCRVSHISQVISGQNHLSLELAFKTAEFLKLSDSETHFFILLVNKGRAGNYKLKEYFHKQIVEILSERTQVNKRLQVSDELTPDQVMHYYSSWYISAIHILCSLEFIKSNDDIIERLKISKQQVDQSVDFLIETNILKKSKNGLKTTGRRIHLDSKSKLISKHHSNWRIKSMNAFDQFKNKNLHFSAVYSFADKDWKQLKEILLKSLEDSEKVIKDSPQDTLAALCIDFFEI